MGDNMKIAVAGTGYVGLSLSVLPFTPVYKNLIISMDYYGVKSVFDLFKPKFIDNIVFSNRIAFANPCGVS